MDVFFGAADGDETKLGVVFFDGPTDQPSPIDFIPVFALVAAFCVPCPVLKLPPLPNVAGLAFIVPWPVDVLRVGVLVLRVGVDVTRLLEP